MKELSSLFFVCNRKWLGPKGSPVLNVIWTFPNQLIL